MAVGPRFTLGIAAAALALIGITLMLVSSQPQSQPSDEAMPGGVVHNYYLAIMRDDLRTAYNYLSADTRGWLSYEQFAAQVSSRPETRAVRILDERLEGDTG